MTPAPQTDPRIDSEATWHDAECGSYAGDLPTWAEIAVGCDGPILDLGAGTGRVALHLAARGHEIVAVDSDPALVAAMAERAASRGLPVTAIDADGREFEQPGAFDLILAPMQFVHLLGGSGGRLAMLGAACRSLRPGGELCAALLEEPLPPLGPPGPDEPPPLPDIREIDGWVHSSLPVEIRISEESVSIERLRQLVSPRGELTERAVSVTLDRVTATTFESEAGERGLEASRRIPIAETERHVGSVISCLRRPA